MSETRPCTETGSSSPHSAARATSSACAFIGAITPAGSASTSRRSPKATGSRRLSRKMASTSGSWSARSCSAPIDSAAGLDSPAGLAPPGTGPAAAPRPAAAAAAEAASGTAAWWLCARAHSRATPGLLAGSGVGRVASSSTESSGKPRGHAGWRFAAAAASASSSGRASSPSRAGRKCGYGLKTRGAVAGPRAAAAAAGTSLRWSGVAVSLRTTPSLWPRRERRGLSPPCVVAAGSSSLSSSMSSTTRAPWWTA